VARAADSKSEGAEFDAPIAHQFSKSMSYTKNQASFDEALLEHYDDLMDHQNYQTVLDRMRKNGYEPTGEGAPRKTSPYYKGDGSRADRCDRDV
jgi:hypothetical protein